MTTFEAVVRKPSGPRTAHLRGGQEVEDRSGAGKRVLVEERAEALQVLLHVLDFALGGLLPEGAARQRGMLVIHERALQLAVGEGGADVDAEVDAFAILGDVGALVPGVGVH
jgi:hypothetical protein